MEKGLDWVVRKQTSWHWGYSYINYITKKRHDQTRKEEILEDSNSKADNDVEYDLKNKAKYVHLHV